MRERLTMTYILVYFLSTKLIKRTKVTQGPRFNSLAMAHKPTASSENKNL